MKFDTINNLLSGDLSTEDIPSAPREVCTISHLMFTVEILKKNNADLNSIRSGATELHEALKADRAILWPLDSQILQESLFDYDVQGERIFSRAIVTAGHPADSMAIASLANFDFYYSTRLIDQFEPLYA